MATFKKPKSIIKEVGFCSGCGHGIIQRMIAESIEELGLEHDTIGIVDIACSYWSLEAMDYDCIAGPHGRCAAVGTGIKKVRPNKNVYVHAGDGCSYVIGLSETLFTAVRDVPITMIVVNNGIFGMTGGQLCLATTLVGDKTVSSVKGRDRKTYGQPFDVLNSIKNFDVEFVARGALYDPSHINQTKKYIKRGFENPYPENLNVYELAGTDMANAQSNARGTNLVVLGGLMKASEMRNKETFAQQLNAFFDKKGKNNPKNEACFVIGYDQVVKK